MQHSAESLKARKDRLLKLVRKVNDLKKNEEGLRALKLLQSEPVCNKRVITKYARVVKDPDPIATTQLLIGQKYPMLAKVKYLKEFTDEEKSEYFDTEKDCRRAGWIRCNKGALDCWISKSRPLSEEQKQVIKVLYENACEAVKDYYSRSWSRCKVTYGTVPKERQVVATKKPLVEVPREFRQKAVVEIIQPGHNLNQPEVEIYVREILSKIGHKIVLGLSIVDQARILMDSLDPRMRMLPVAINLHGSLAQHSISYYGSNWMVTQLPGRELDSPGETHELRKACERILKELFKTEPRTWKDRLNRITKEGKKKLPEVIKQVSENYAVKVLKTILGLPCHKTHEYMGTEMIVEKASQRQQIVYNPNKVRWIEYLDEEKIYFKEKECRGWFIHEGSVLKEIIFSRTDRVIFERLLANIANYIRYDWLIRVGRNQKEVRTETFLEVSTMPWKFLQTDVREYNAFWQHIQDSYFPVTDEMKNYLAMNCYGKVVRCMLETEIPGDIEVHYTLEPDRSLSEIGGGSRIPASEITIEEGHLDISWNSNDMTFIPILHPRTSFWRTIEFHRSRKDLEIDIMNSQFSTANSHCPEWLTQRNERSAFCAQARMMLYGASYEQKVWPKIYLAFLYCFAGYYRTPSCYKSKTRFSNMGVIDLYVREGLFTFDLSKSIWLIYGEEWRGMDDKLGGVPEMLAYSFMTGYRMESLGQLDSSAGCEVMGLKDGISVLRERPDYSFVVVQVGNLRFRLVRDRTTDLKKSMALKRGLDRYIEDREGDLMSLNVKKRKLSD
ncbi:polymerase PB2 [Araguari virus]|uniref:Polymerase PB2 n=1 Tax=Araguari virus TaxID=352236 RepID=A0A343FNE0_9ORTO|nr:polymerase PB2 [Araguari virus]ASR92123.1 polymerase PB2 [Araguari virus]